MITIKPEFQGSARGPRAGLGGSPKPSVRLTISPFPNKIICGTKFSARPPKTARQRRALPMLRTSSGSNFGIRIKRNNQTKTQRCGDATKNRTLPAIKGSPPGDSILRTVFSNNSLHCDLWDSINSAEIFNAEVGAEKRRGGFSLHP